MGLPIRRLYFFSLSLLWALGAYKEKKEMTYAAASAHVVRFADRFADLLLGHYFTDRELEFGDTPRFAIFTHKKEDYEVTAATQQSNDNGEYEVIVMLKIIDLECGDLQFEGTLERGYIVSTDLSDWIRRSPIAAIDLLLPAFRQEVAHALQGQEPKDGSWRWGPSGPELTFKGERLAGRPCPEWDMAWSLHRRRDVDRSVVMALLRILGPEAYTYWCEIRKVTESQEYYKSL